MADCVCLYCGSKSGTPATVLGKEDWFWKTLRHGKIGPFCSQEHAAAFRYPADAFTLQQYDHLSFMRWNYRNEHESVSD